MSTVESFIPAPTVAQRVRYGAALLDEHTPGWAEAVDAVALDLSKADQCILGQLFGTYRKGAQLLYGENIGRGVYHGFDIDTGDEREDEEYRAEFEMLTAEWERLLAEREAVPA